MELNTEKGRK